MPRAIGTLPRNLPRRLARAKTGARAEWNSVSVALAWGLQSARAERNPTPDVPLSIALIQS